MSPLHAAQRPLVVTEDVAGMLADLQANILQGHARDHVVLLLLSFGDNADDFRSWLTAIRPQITTAADQRAASAYYAGIARRGTAVMTVSLGWAGYRLLGLDDPEAFRELGDDDRPTYPFSDGMARRTTLPDDPPPERWAARDLMPSDEHPVHVLLLLADSDFPRLQDDERRRTAALPGSAAVIARREGHVLRNGGGEAIEHFGFRDGISQPLFFADEVDDVARSEGISRFDPGRPPALVLRPDPYGRSDTACGSMLVLRQLAQDVRGFRDCEDSLAQALGAANDADRRTVEAMIVGRDRIGRPLLTSTPQAINDFNFRDDHPPSFEPRFFRCPVHAHIRKVNPRHDMRLSDRTEKRVLARRSITYGVDPVTSNAVADPTVERGLLFMCYQRSIRRQFEFVQTSWMHDEAFPTPGTGADPVAVTGSGARRTWPPLAPGGNPVQFPFAGFVTLMGGGYFFTPSIGFFARWTA